MTPMLAMYTTTFGPAPTLLGMVIGICWVVCLLRKYPLNQPRLRILSVLLMCASLSMALGFNDTFDERFAQGGSYGGELGEFVAKAIRQLDLPMLTGIVITLLIVAVIASVILATEWLGIPLFFRMQQMQPSFAGSGGHPGLGTGATAATAPMMRMGEKRSAAPPLEDDSTADPLVSFGGGSDAATATLDRDDVQASTYVPPAGVFPSSGSPYDDEVMPLSAGGETIAPDDAAEGADTPWYARRRARREAQRLEREAAEREAAERGEPTARAPLPVEDEPAPAFDERREFDSTESQAATSDLMDRLAEGVEADALPATPAPPEAFDAVVAEPPAPAAPPVANASDDSFDDFFGGVQAALEAPPEPTQAAAPIVEAAPLETAPAETSAAETILPEPAPVEASLVAPVASPPIESAPIEAAPPEIANESPIVEITDQSAAIEPIHAEPAPQPTGAAAPDDSEQQLFLAAGDAVVTGQRASISFLQRSLSIGYFQAAKLLDRLEREGVIGPYTGAVSRVVLMDPATWSRHRAS